MKLIIKILFIILIISSFAHSELFKLKNPNFKKFIQIYDKKIKQFSIGNRTYVKGDKNEILKYYNEDELEYVKPVKRELFYIPNDEFFDKQWYLNNENDTDINWPEAIDLVNSNDELIVAVVDSGIAYNHVDLEGKILNGGDFGNYGFSFCNSDNSTYDIVGHGTHVAGIIAANTDNSFGIAGITNNKIKILNLKIACGTDASITIDDELESIAKILDLIDKGYPIKVVNMSLGGIDYSDEEYNAINQLINKGVIVVSAAGNDGDDIKNYPAAYNGVISVGATKEDDYLASYSNYGAWVDIYAPGDYIISTYNESLLKNISNPYLIINEDFSGSIDNLSYNGWQVENNYLTFSTNSSVNCDNNSIETTLLNTFQLQNFTYKKFVALANINTDNGSIVVYNSFDNGSTWVKLTSQSGIQNNEFYYIVSNITTSQNVKYKICYEGGAGAVKIDFLKIGGSNKSDAFAYESGTSMATPVVSAAVALALLEKPSLTESEIVNFLYSTGEDLKNYSGKRLNLYDFLYTIKHEQQNTVNNESSQSSSGGGGGCSTGTSNNFILLILFILYRAKLRFLNKKK
ncbi:hypothetical protein DEFDS_0796 [Deferribacter desulfuricans SSM1]|uniref:Peptidase S8/S53 domain-containing protein n=1 Tax=Deferribacter desulfuricans (strain DSM 14783 / JCM 11476 / NBRC 101012 / SSM1) TaxID=639282 RepID=D3PCF1_DEFDS|nr:S8 family serine peptidase [Deferribacter desulfuricans]BAI80274.1 hypothetical protein DEFDS_0796 [Deferribacter desulfuricans SSM1]